MGIFQSIANAIKGKPEEEAPREPDTGQKRKVPRIVESKDKTGPVSPLILTAAMIHDTPADSIRTKEGFWLPDGRSYVSELWTWEGITNVTYYFPALGIGSSKEELEAYLVSMGKLAPGERHPLGIASLEVKGEEVYSVTVAVGSDDGIDSEIYCKAYL